MKMIVIEDDIYKYLLSKTIEIGETASSILRREIPSFSEKARSTCFPVQQPGPSPHELTAVLASQKMTALNATDKYLLILSEIHKINPSDFEALCTIVGSHRKFFAHEKKEIECSGTSTTPRPIPETPYWALTNLNTSDKQDKLRRALTLLGYSAAAIKAATEAIA